MPFFSSATTCERNKANDRGRTCTELARYPFGTICCIPIESEIGPFSIDSSALACVVTAVNNASFAAKNGRCISALVGCLQSLITFSVTACDISNLFSRVLNKEEGRRFKAWHANTLRLHSSICRRVVSGCCCCCCC